MESSRSSIKVNVGCIELNELQTLNLSFPLLRHNSSDDPPQSCEAAFD